MQPNNPGISSQKKNINIYYCLPSGSSGQTQKQRLKTTSVVDRPSNSTTYQSLKIGFYTTQRQKYLFLETILTITCLDQRTLKQHYAPLHTEHSLPEDTTALQANLIRFAPTGPGLPRNTPGDIPATPKKSIYVNMHMYLPMCTAQTNKHQDAPYSYFKSYRCT